MLIWEENFDSKKKENSVTVYEVKYIWKMKMFATQFRQLHNILGTKI